MKKLLILTLVLGIAGLASASLSMAGSKTNLLTGEVATITISSTASGISGGWLGYLQAELGGVGALSNPIDYSGGDKSAALPYSDSSGIGYEITTASTTGALIAGAQWTFKFSSATQGTATVDLWDDAVGYVTPVGSLQFVVTPEPMTMLLLGLGGLFLRKR